MSYEHVRVQPARMTTAATKLRGSVLETEGTHTGLQGLRETLIPYEGYMPLLALTGEVGEELEGVALILSLTVELMEAADRGWSDADMAGLESRLYGAIRALDMSINDDLGSAGTAAEMRDAIERATFGQAGMPIPPDGLNDRDYPEWYANNVTAVIVAGLSLPEAARYWGSLSQGEQDALIEVRHDLVAMQIMPTVQLSDRELQLMSDENAYVVWVTQLWADLDLSLNLGVVSLDLGGGVEVTFEKLSNGNIVMQSGMNLSAGLSRGIGSGDTDASVGAGLIRKVTNTFVFTSETDAAFAAGQVLVAAQQDGSGGIIRAIGNRAKDDDPSLLGWLVFPTVHATAWAIGEVAGSDGPTHVEQALDAMWDEHGIETSTGTGVYVSGAGEVDFGPLEVELAGEATAMYNQIEGRPDTMGVSRTEYSFNVDLSANGEIELPEIFGQGGLALAGSAEVSASVLYSDPADGSPGSITVTVSAQGGTGVAVEEDYGIAEVDVTTESIRRVDYEMTVVLDDQNKIGIASAMVDGLLRGELPIDRLDEFGVLAEETTTYGAGVRTNAEVEGEYGVASFEVNVGSQAVETTLISHTLPGGEPYDPAEVQHRIDSQQRNNEF